VLRCFEQSSGSCSGSRLNDIVIFKYDIPVVFYKFNMYSVQLAVKTQLIYCTVCIMYKNYMFRPILAIFRFFV